MYHRISSSQQLCSKFWSIINGKIKAEREMIESSGAVDVEKLRCGTSAARRRSLSTDHTAEQREKNSTAAQKHLAYAKFGAVLAHQNLKKLQLLYRKPSKPPKY